MQKSREAMSQKSKGIFKTETVSALITSVLTDILFCLEFNKKDVEFKLVLYDLSNKESKVDKSVEKEVE